MNWCSVDPSNKSGIAYWVDGKLVSTKVLRRVGAKGKYALGSDTFDSRWTAWDKALVCVDHVITEEGCGRFATAIKSQAGIRGYIEAVCDHKTALSLTTSFVAVNVSEWRRVIKEGYGISWPATTERKKALSVQLVKTHFGIDVSDDEADAVLLGVAAMRMGVVNVREATNASK